MHITAKQLELLLLPETSNTYKTYLFRVPLFCFRYLKRLQNAAQVFKNWMLEVPSGEPAHLHDDHWGGLRNTPGVGSEGLRVRVDQERGHVLPVPGRAVPEDAEVSDRPPAGVVHRVRYRVLGSQSFWQVSQGFFA